MKGPRILGRAMAVEVIASQWVLTGLTCVLLLVYPMAVVLLGASRGNDALRAVVVSVMVTILRGIAAARSTRVTRRTVYGALAAAIRGQPALAREGSIAADQVENEIARGAAWVEAYFAITLPSLIGALLAVPVIVWISASTIGTAATLVGGAALLIGFTAGAFVARSASRVATEAWDNYERIAALVDRALRGRAELMAHGLDRDAELRIQNEVNQWSILEQRAYLMGSLTGWTAPSVAIAIAAGAAVATGVDPLALATRSVNQPDKTAIVASLLAMSALPTVLMLSRTLREIALQRPHVLALELFVASSRVPNPLSEIGDPGDIRVEKVVHKYLSRGPGSDVEVKADFTWRSTESVGILGPNGCGKTTLVLMIIGLLEPSAGQVRIGKSNGKLVGRVAYLPQQAFFSDTDSVRDAIDFAAPDAQEAEAVELLRRLLPTFDPHALLDRRVSSLSAGERRLVALARVLLRNTSIVIVDEPEANLDVASKGRALETLRDVARTRRLLIVTHDPEFGRLAHRTFRFVDRSVDDRNQSEPRGSSTECAAASEASE